MSEIDSIILNGTEYELAGSGEGGLTADLKAALDQLAQKVAYIDEDGQDYYDALHSALYPPANLSSITCVYTQSGTVYDTDSLDSLKSDLVVTAHFSDSTTQIITSYTLSGSLTEGTSIVTVTYGGKSTTFNVTVTHAIPNTTAQIAKEGYIFSGTSGGEVTKANGGETIKYQLDSPTTILHPAGVIVNDGLFSTSSGQLQVYKDGTYVIYADEKGRWGKAPASSYTEFNSQSWTVSEYNQIAFSVDIRYLDDSYMYDYVTGQVWFAGINTPYYGMRNISEANS